MEGEDTMLELTMSRTNIVRNVNYNLKGGVEGRSIPA
jgi:hypothetical protein